MLKKKPIYLKLTDNLFEAIKEKITKTPLSGTSINIDLASMLEKTYANIEPPRIYFTEHAFLKMQALVDACNDEVAWHGIVSIENLNYIITDIIVYPQTVTGATVSTDEQEYALWNLSLDNNTVNNLRLQGHSHVNFGVTPSGTDDAYYKELLEQIKDFYIFLIINKKGSIYIRFYDVTQNVEFDDVPLAGVISETGELLNDWVTESLKQVKRPIYKAPVTPHKTPNYNNFPGYKYMRDTPYDDEFESEEDTERLFFDAQLRAEAATKKKPGRPKKK